MSKRQAKTAELPSCGDEWGSHYRVGDKARVREGNSWIDGPTITAITIEDDLPGLHCNMERVKVWSDDHLLAEMPLHHVLEVRYV